MTPSTAAATVQHMNRQHDADVAVIGYGPTGLMAALTLAGRGIKVAALEREESIYPRARSDTGAAHP